jgi:hypothetical protein
MRNSSGREFHIRLTSLKVVTPAPVGSQLVENQTENTSAAA